MKRLLCLAPLLVSPLLSPRVVQQHDEPETELSRQMERIEDAVKLLRKSLRDPGDPSAALGSLAEIEGLSLQCKALTPQAASRLPEIFFCRGKWW